MIREFYKLLRIEQWTKNIFIFLPLFFDKRFTDWANLTACLYAFIGFSIIASSIYCFNDIMDREVDKIHPDKKQRPIASGKISVKVGYILTFFLSGLGISIILISNLTSAVLLTVFVYLILNVVYSLKLKHVAIIDVFIIALGFVLRILIGGFAGHVHLSHWIILMTFLLALFLGFAKRLDDVRLYDKSGNISRKNIMRYNTTFLNSILVITATITIMSYIQYTISDEVVERFHSDKVYITSVFVILGIFRYLQLTIVDNSSANPTKILIKDKFIHFSIIMWIITFIIIIYF